MSIKKSPVYNVIAVPVEKVQANDYNPNVVAPPEMRLLNFLSGKTASLCPASAIMIRKRMFISLSTVSTVILC